MNEYTIQKEQLNEDDFDLFKAHLQSSFYEQIVKLDKVIDLGNYTEDEAFRIILQRKKLADVFFERLNSEVETYWKTLETYRNEFDAGVTFPKQIEILRERTEQKINKILLKYPHLKTEQIINETKDFLWSKYEGTTNFLVGIELAKGTIDELKNLKNNYGKKYKDEEVVNKLFGHLNIPESQKDENYKKGQATKKAIRSLISRSYNETQDSRNVRNKEELVNAIICFCVFQNYQIKESFFKETYIKEKTHYDQYKPETINILKQEVNDI